MNNSKNADFDWHKEGFYVMYTPAGDPMLDSLNTSAWGCRAELIRGNGPGWSKRAEQGYYVQELAPV